MDTNSEFEKLIQERFAKLPKVLQNAITSADVTAHMRELAEKHQLHLDQWQTLENEVQLTLLGAAPADELAANIQKEVGVDAATATSLASDIFKVVFEPIREELERELEHPDAVAATVTDVESMRTDMLAQEQSLVAVPAAAPNAPTTPVAPTAAPVAPATPSSAPVVTAKVERAPLSTTYAPSQPSHERKAIEGDPYREQLI